MAHGHQDLDWTFKDWKEYNLGEGNSFTRDYIGLWTIDLRRDWCRGMGALQTEVGEVRVCYLGQAPWILI